MWSDTDEGGLMPDEGRELRRRAVCALERIADALDRAHPKPTERPKITNYDDPAQMVGRFPLRAPHPFERVTVTGGRDVCAVCGSTEPALIHRRHEFAFRGGAHGTPDRPCDICGRSDLDPVHDTAP